MFPSQANLTEWKAEVLAQGDLSWAAVRKHHERAS